MPEEADTPLTQPRSGSYADLSRRMDRLESSHEGLTKDVSAMATSLAKMEASQDHVEEMTRLRLDMVVSTLATVSSRLESLGLRFEDAVSGRGDNPQARQYWEERRQNIEWRQGIDRWIAEKDGQAQFSARALTFLMTIVGIVTSAAMYLLTHVRW